MLGFVMLVCAVVFIGMLFTLGQALGHLVISLTIMAWREWRGY